ncbi:imidazolonepropionase [Rubripirellula lacrimiformis]|uniref:Imidazolonepropionase n=1 Tax=Rubripirellula lacrimiformis TaxID=1930273 RepID=A0A517NIW1_9BACT|nr:amidohydrolase family protein [Rubripirellula lacrimiformis]QDT07072.1 imidazolonepropionase [Rubripirellula lacrimiformis]
MRPIFRCAALIAMVAMGKLVVLADEHGPPVKHREMNSITPAAESRAVVITHARLIDGNGGPPIENACVVVSGDKIVFAGAQTEATIPDDAITFDAGGKSLLPGLFDSHFHSRDSADRPIQYELNNGITSFRDPGHPFKFYDWLDRNSLTIPRVFLCGGHLDAVPPAWPKQAVVIESAQHAAAAVDAHVARGASAIKIYMRLPVEHIAAACEAADRHGIPVTAHLELIRADAAINAGVDGIEHVTSFGTALADPKQAGIFEEVVGNDSNARREWRPRLWSNIELENNPRLKPLLDQLLHQGTFVSPTLAIFESRTGQKNATSVTALAFANMLRFTELCHQHGVKIVVGSHTAAPFAEQGKAYLREVELLVEAGMSPLEVITAATKTNSEFFGVQDRLGTIQPGKLADLILVDGFPDKTVQDLDNVSRVMLGGNWVDPQN